VRSNKEPTLDTVAEEQPEPGLVGAAGVAEAPAVVWTSLGPLPRWVPGPTTQWAPRTTRLVLHDT
jgi:hypothetical protein